jgi:hypothetical protein
MNNSTHMCTYALAQVWTHNLMELNVNTLTIKLEISFG